MSPMQQSRDSQARLRAKRSFIGLAFADQQSGD